MSKYKGIFNEKILLFEDLDDIETKEIWLPEPPNLSDVINYRASTANQKFTPNQMPSDLKKLTYNFTRNKMANGKENKADNPYSYLNKHMNKWILNEYNTIFGTHWCFIRGKLFPIPGYQYHGCTYWSDEGGDPLRWLYRDWLWYVHWQYDIEIDPKCYGMIEMTSRRGGKSTRATNTGWCRTFAEFGRHMGIQSKTKGSSEELLSKGIVNPVKNLPFWLRPKISTGTSAKEIVKLQDQSRRGANSFFDKKEELNGWIEAGPSKEAHFDGTLMHTYIGDEEGKTEEANVETRWNLIKPAQFKMGEVVGKSIHTTTVEDITKASIENWTNLWNESHRNGDSYEANQETISGLHKHFTPGDMNIYFDEYGFSLREKSLEEIERKRKMLKSKPKALIKYKRKFPLTIKESLASAGNECPFDIGIIEDRLLDFDLNPMKYLRQGTFEWIDEEDWSKGVEWRDTKNGHFKVSKLFDNVEDTNNFSKTRNGYIPHNRHIMGGGDSFMYSNVEGKGSLGAGAWFLDRDSVIDTNDKPKKDWQTYRFICTYLGRPRTKRKYCEDMLKACLYYGCLMFPEANIDAIEDFFIENGFKKFLYYDVNSSGKKKAQAGAKNTGDKTRESILEEIEFYIDEFGPYEKHPELLEAWKDTDPDDLNPHDLTVASGYAVYGLKRKNMRYKKKKKTSEEEKTNKRSFVRTYVITN